MGSADPNCRNGVPKSSHHRYCWLQASDAPGRESRKPARAREKRKPAQRAGGDHGAQHVDDHSGRHQRGDLIVLEAQICQNMLIILPQYRSGQRLRAGADRHGSCRCFGGA